MSTILDALKKSEQERKLNDLPRLSDMPAPREASRWPWVLIAILSLVLALVLGILLSQWWLGSNKPAAANASFSASAQTTEAQIAGAGVVDARVHEAPAEVVVNVVSYSENPEQRFVMLDGRMYRENDFVRAGLKVEQIKPNSVVLNSRGTLLTRTP